MLSRLVNIILAGGGFQLRIPKYSSRRTLILPPFLGALLHLLLESHDSQWAFPTARLRPLRVDDRFCGRFWHPIIDGHPELPQIKGRPHRAALLTAEGIEGMVPNGTRHGQRVWLDEDGISKAVIDERMGHKVWSGGRMDGPRTYRHVTPRMRLQIARALERRWHRSVKEREKMISQKSPN
ncbi:hypothetical protein ACWGIB_21255 [Streptomyces xiamenensis]